MVILRSVYDVERPSPWKRAAISPRNDENGASYHAFTSGLKIANDQPQTWNLYFLCVPDVH
ncbi:hypothetical protein IFM47457_11078 [Aspergillus lentulus]|nr:hypothetical protein IFM47457_11078 [Aspergillus lentulus]